MKPMSLELLVLDMSHYSVDEVNSFCISWSELENKDYKISKPKLVGEELRTTLPENASIRVLFELSSEELALPYIVFRPRLDVFNILAWQALERSLHTHSRGVRIVSLTRDVFAKAMALYPEGMVTFNTALL